jgi:hypothetical protein
MTLYLGMFNRRACYFLAESWRSSIARRDCRIQRGKGLCGRVAGEVELSRSCNPRDNKDGQEIVLGRAIDLSLADAEVLLYPSLVPVCALV